LLNSLEMPVWTHFATNLIKSLRRLEGPVRDPPKEGLD
jgi:hypothetical protein